MKVQINNYVFEEITWNVQNGIGILHIVTDESIVSIITKIGENNDIEVYNDENVLVAKWYNSGILNINEYKNDTGDRFIEINFSVSILDSNAEQTLQTGIDESVDGIMELADLYCMLDENHTETRRRIDLYSQSVQEIAQNFDNKHTDTNRKFDVEDERIRQLSTAISSLQDGLVAVQDAVGDIPNNIVQRFSEIWASYNALADRVAALENK